VDSPGSPGEISMLSVLAGTSSAQLRINPSSPSYFDLKNPPSG
jgi:hypothetical protein